MRYAYFGAAAMIASGIASTGLAAQELRVIAGSGSAAPANVMIVDFEKATGAKVKIEYASGGAVRDRVLKGEQFDAGLIPNEVLKPLLDAGKLVAASKSVFAEARLAFAVKKGAPKPNATSIELLQTTLTNAKSIAYADPKSGASIGIMFANMIEQWAPSWGMAEEIEKKTILTPSVTAIADALKSGKADIGAMLTTQIAADPGIEVGSLLPEELRMSNIYVGFVMADSKQQELAAKFIAFLSTPAAADVVRSKGFEVKR